MRASRALLAQAATLGELREVLSTSPYSGRVHVLDRALCDDSLRLIRQSLPKKNTCDVIDFNPGVGVWSQALHKELQPRRHILVEPERKQYSQWLDPLVNQPASRYRWASDFQTALNHENGLLSPEITNKLVGKENESPPRDYRKRYTDTLLITANLATPLSKAGFRGTPSNKFLLEYYQSLYYGTLDIHRYGTVRLIAWLDNATGRTVMPISVATQSKQSIQLDSAFSATLVASPSPPNSGAKHSHRTRWYEADLENYKDVLETQKRLGIEHPLHRRSMPPLPPIDYFEPNIDFIATNQDQFTGSTVFVRQLLTLRALLQRKTPEWFPKYNAQMEHRASLGYKGGGRNAGSKSHVREDTDEQILYRKLLTRLRTHRTTWKKCTEFINEHRALWREFASAYKKGVTFIPGSSEEADELLEKHRNLSARTSALKHDSQVRIFKGVDDYRSYDADLKSLAWNRREYEPLKVVPQDFHPQRKPLVLIDFVPREEHLKHIDTIDKWVCFHHVLGMLTSHPRDTILQAIKRLVPVDHEAFMKTIPDLYNIPKGSWFDLDDVRLRTVPHEFYMQVALAYEKWPDRRSASEMLRMATVLEESLNSQPRTKRNR